MQTNQYSRKGFLYLIPLILAITLFYNLKVNRFAFIQTVDPEYIHLMSSVNLANGETKLLSIENPGTSLYLVGALTVRATHLITGSGKNLTDDFLLNPEKYVLWFRITLAAILVISLICAGLIVYKHSGHLSLAMFLQLSPFISFETLYSTGIISPENLLVTVMTWFVTLLFLQMKSGPENERKFAVYFAVIVAIGLATKLTFIPLFVLPLFLFSKNRNRFLYTGLVVVLTLIIAFPVVMQFKRFISWTTGLFLHSGMYGTGKEQVIDFHLFLQNLIHIFRKAWLFITTFILTLFYLPGAYKRNKENPGTFRFFLAIALVFLLQLFLTSKHYALRYLIPSLMLIPYVIHSLLSQLNLSNKAIGEKRIRFIMYILILPFLGIGLSGLIKDNIKNNDHRDSRLGGYNYIKKNLQSQTMLIIPNYFNSSSVRYALYFSGVWAGQYGNEYFDKLQQFYPGSYFYFPWKEGYYQWNHLTGLYDILKKYESLFIYASLDATDANVADFRKEIENKLDYFNRNGKKIIRYEPVYHAPFDIIYRLATDTSALNDFYNFEVSSCNMEKVSSDSRHFDSNGMLRFSFEYNQTDDDANSGKFSQYLNKDRPYGSHVIIDSLKAGDYIQATLWIKSNDDHCYLVAESKEASGFYKTSNLVVQTNDGWDQIELAFSIDPRIAGKLLNVYIYYNGNTTVYADDFAIKIGHVDTH